MENQTANGANGASAPAVASHAPARNRVYCFPRSNPLSLLTPRELEVLALLCDGLSNKAIARALELKDITIAFHLKGIFRKLQVSGRLEAAMVAIELGFGSEVRHSVPPPPAAVREFSEAGFQALDFQLATVLVMAMMTRLVEDMGGCQCQCGGGPAKATAA